MRAYSTPYTSTRIVNTTLHALLLLTDRSCPILPDFPKEAMDIGEKCRKVAQEWYQRKLEFNMPLSWRSDVKIQTEGIFRNFAVVQKKNEEPVEMEDILSPSKFTRGKVPLRILIEGDPGFGKTEICERMAYDWAKGEEYLSKYNLLLYLETKALAGKTIQDLITSNTTVFPEDFEITGPEIWDYVNKNQKNILFIVDAYDELGSMDHQDDEIFKVFSGYKLRDATVVVTCRSNICPDLHSLCDKHVRIRPFTRQNIEKVIRNYFIDENDAEELLRRIDFNDERVSDVLSIPLNVHLICVLWEDSMTEDEAKFPHTVTDIFTVLSKLNIRKYCHKINLNMGKDVPEICQRIMEGMTKLAHDAVISENFRSIIEDEALQEQFKDPEERREVVRMGFLAKKSRLEHGAVVTYYDFVSGVWRDYFAAFYLYNQLKTNCMKRADVDQRLLKCQGYHLVRTFLNGLLEESITMNSESEVSVFSNVYHWLGKV